MIKLIFIKISSLIIVHLILTLLLGRLWSGFIAHIPLLSMDQLILLRQFRLIITIDPSRINSLFLLHLRSSLYGFLILWPWGDSTFLQVLLLLPISLILFFLLLLKPCFQLMLTLLFLLKPNIHILVKWFQPFESQ